MANKIPETGTELTDEELAAHHAAEQAAPLDLLLTEAALGVGYKFRPRTAAVRLAAKLGTKPGTVARRTTELAQELASVAIGSSDIEPEKGDRRFSAEEWSESPVLRRLVQAYLATGRTANDLVEDAELDYDDHELTEFTVRMINESLAPVNNPIVNPAVWQELRKTKGRSAARGAKALASDMKSSPRTPSMIYADDFEVGVDLGISPGSIVERTEMYELIQYKPTTEKVYKQPLLFIPPVVNKFYVVDLAPGRSMVEYFVSQGHQVFLASWRNPTAENKDWGFDAYGQGILDALATTRSISKSEKVNAYSICSGGTVMAMVMAHLAAEGKLGQIASLALAVTVLDSEHSGLMGSALNEATAQAAIARVKMDGYLDGGNMAEVFAWLRPTDLIWNYWINNYLLGRRPAKFDVLYWNADTTRMAAGLHKDFLMMGLHNTLVSGTATMLGSPVDLGAIDTDAFLIGGVRDHICPWEAVYETTQLFGGDTQMSLSTSGHIAAMINPPGNKRSTFRTNPENPPSAEKWYDDATVHQGSWWPHYTEWLGKHGGGMKAAPKKLGSDKYPVIGSAPGTYVVAP
jgi:class II poly(R)-hydroxyalkanoic acid synthase